MDEKILFSAAVRVIGLLSLVRGVYDLFYSFLYFIGFGDISVTAKIPNADLVFGFFYCLLGVYFLRGAALIVNFAFPYQETRQEVIENSNVEKNEL